MNSTTEKLKSHASPTPSRWRDEAKFRRENRSWLRYSQMIAMKMLDKMEVLGMTQKSLADKMGCSQQYISKILRGKENLSLETLCKIEDALELHLIYEVEPV
ncbi:helix-turn-helix domain-containing protein [Bacteroidaceae bacterium]|jgi:ribosome-binding protein aMBF1 (putative translation factor)